MLTILEESSESEDEGVHIELVKVPIRSLCNADAVVDRLEGRLIGALTDTLSEAHAGG